MTDAEAGVGEQVSAYSLKWEDLPLPALKAIGRFLDITSCLSARLVCSSWCDGVSGSITSLLLTPSVLASHGPKAIEHCLSRMGHLDNLDLALAAAPAAATLRGYSPQQLQELLELVARHCLQKRLPALITYNESTARRDRPGQLSLPAGPWRDAFTQGLAALGGRLNCLKLSDPSLLSPKLISELSGLQFLELNLHTAVDVKWQDIARLPALHSLMLVPPISPASMGQSPEHAQQVVPTLLSFSVSAKELLQGLLSAPATAARMKQLLVQQTGVWDETATKLLGHFTSLEALRLFPSPNSSGVLWENLAPVSELRQLRELQLVGYTPINFTNGAATGEALSAALPNLRALELVIEPESDQVAALAALTQLTRIKVMLQPKTVTDAIQGHGVGLDGEGADGIGPGMNGLGMGGLNVVDLQGLMQGLQGLVQGLQQQQQPQQGQQQQQPQEGQQQGQQQQQQQPPQGQQQQQQPPQGQQQQQQPPQGQQQQQQPPQGQQQQQPQGQQQLQQLRRQPQAAAQQGGQQRQQGRAAGVAGSSSTTNGASSSSENTGGLPSSIVGGVDSSSSSSGVSRSRRWSAATAAAPAGLPSLHRPCNRPSRIRRSSSSNNSRVNRASSVAVNGTSSGRRPQASSSAAAVSSAASSSRGKQLVSSFALDDIADVYFSSDDLDEAPAEASVSAADAVSASQPAPLPGSSNVLQQQDTVLSVSTGSHHASVAAGHGPLEAESPGSAAEGAPSSSVGGAESAAAAVLKAGEPLAEGGPPVDGHPSSSEAVPALEAITSSSSGSDSEWDAGSELDHADEGMALPHSTHESTAGGSSSSSDGGGDRDAGDGRTAAATNWGDADGVSDDAASEDAAAVPAEAAAAISTAADGDDNDNDDGDGGNAGNPLAVFQPEVLEMLQDMAHGAAEGEAGNQANNPWNLPALPSDLNCLHPVGELRSLKAFELLSPMVAITDSGVAPLLGLDVEVASPAGDSTFADVSGAGSSAAGKQQQQQQQLTSMLPQLQSLALSGSLFISSKSYKAMRKAFPLLQDLTLVHARPGDAPFDMWDIPGVPQALWPGGPALNLHGAGQINIQGVGPINVNVDMHADMAPLLMGGAAAAAGNPAAAAAGGQDGDHQQQQQPLPLQEPDFLHQMFGLAGPGVVGGAAAGNAANAGAAAGGAPAQPAAAAGPGAGPGLVGAAGAGPFGPLLQQAMHNFPNLPHGAAAVQMVQVGDQPPMLFGPHGPLNAAAAAAAVGGNQQQQPPLAAAGGGAAGAAAEGQGVAAAEAAAGGAAGANAAAAGGMPQELMNLMQQLIQQVMPGGGGGAAAAAGGGGAGGAGAGQPPGQPAQPAGAAAAGAGGAGAGAMHGHFNIVDVQIHHVPADVAAGLQQQQQQQQQPMVQQLPNGVMMMMMPPVFVDEVQQPPANAGVQAAGQGLHPGAPGAAGQAAQGQAQPGPGLAAGGVAGQQQQQQQPPQAAGEPQQQQQQQPQGFMQNLLGGLGGNLFPQMMLGGAGGASEPGEHIAPTKLSAEDLPLGLRQLHLVNVGFKSSKVPLPCAKLQHLQIERCKAARAFRIPDLTRCSKLMTLQLVNCYLEPNTLSTIAASCPFLQRLCLTDFKAYDTSAPRKRWEIVFESQQQQQQQQQPSPSASRAAGSSSSSSSQTTSTSAAGRGSGLTNSSSRGGGGGGGRGSRMRRILRDVDEPEGVDLDWSALKQMRCLNALALKSSRAHVLAAADRLAQLQHTVKNLKFEAQGLKLSDLEMLGNQLPLLPHLTWLTLVLQYKPERLRQLEGGAGEQPSAAVGDSAAAVAGAGDVPGDVAGGVAAQAAAAAFPLQVPPVPWAQMLQQHHANQQQQQQLPGEQGDAGPAAWPGLWPGTATQSAWQWEAANRLSRVLMKELPGTALELKVRPQSTMFFG